MARDQFPHIFIKKSPDVMDYTSPKGGAKALKLPKRNRPQHGKFLKNRFKNLWEQAKKEERKAVSLPAKDGFYIEFRGKVGFELVTKSLENIKSGIRLLNIREEKHGDQKMTIATIYVPYSKADLFLKKIDKYLTEQTKNREPKNKNLIESIEDIQKVVLESFWQDDKNLMPTDNKVVECEVWIRVEDKAEDKLRAEVDKFFKVCDELNKTSQNTVKYRREQNIFFPERVVVLIRANKKQLLELIKSSDQIAEFRRAKETARFWLEQENKDQAEWVEDLLKRLIVDKKTNVAVCLLDTGVNNGHPLLAPVVSDKDCHTVNPKWGVDDKDGHGTAMSGLVVYGDVQKSVESKGKVNIAHTLESVKLIPKSGKDNKKELYGYWTKQGISRAEITKPQRKRTVCMAVTSTDDRDKGRPSSWSGAVDQITSGAEEKNKKRLLIVSAGNVDGQSEWNNYPESNKTNAVHDPAQSWNALTVGAYTEKELITDPNLKGYKPVAKKGELSPFSSTSLAWDAKKWPIKPDIVLEGGNIAIDKEAKFTTVSKDLSLLSLHHQPQEHQFEMLYATSVATAEAGWMASQIQVKYPEIWPETIRALIVHSAEWKKSMRQQFWKDNQSKKKNYKTMLRIFGYGAPDINKAVSSYKNSLTLISEQTLQPFTKKSSHFSTKDMHFYEMPWPKGALKSLSDQTDVQLRFTLSYFIEPGPGEIGWKDRYRYPSHGLRFALIKPQENEDQFVKRINKAVRDEEEKFNSELDNRWMFGAQNRDIGSIHSDIWEGTASEIAECNLMSVYPTIGWWKTRHHLGKWNEKARYSLIVSLSTPEEQVDLYTPVAIKIGVPVKV